MKDKIRKYLLPNLPYLFFVYLFDKLCQAVRLAPGLDVSEKLLHIGQGFQTAFASSAPSFHALDICVGIGLVRKYTRARKLTPRMLNELVEKIEVFNAEKIDGVWEQRLRIHYNCVGTIEIPTVLPLPIPEVSVNTRKGVVVNYAPCELAV